MVSFMTNNYNRSIIHVYVYSLSFLLLVFLTSYTSAQSSNERRLPPPPPPPPPSARTFRPSMIVIIVVLIVAFFFMGFFSIYIRQCVNRSRPGDTIRPANGGAGGGGGRSRRAKKGLDPSVIETFPTFIYSAVKALKLGKGTLECAVCLNEFEDDETLRLLPKCDHVFHPECIDAWLLSHTTCPVCRSNLNEINYSTTIDESGSQIENQNDSDDDESESDSEIQTSSGINNQSQEHVLIRVIDDKKIKSESSSTITTTTTTSEPELINPSEKIQIQNRPVRSRSVRPSSKFPRSHSTGHSLIQPGENFDRFTLKLPEDIRKQIIEESQLNRMVRQTSVSGDGNNRRGFRSGSVGTTGGGRFYQFGRLSKSDHWGFKLAVPFFTRSTSSRDPITLTDSSVKSPFDRLGSKRERANHPPSSPPPPPQSQQPQPPIRRPAV